MGKVVIFSLPQRCFVIIVADCGVIAQFRVFFVWDVSFAIVEDMAPHKTVDELSYVAFVDINVVEVLAGLVTETWIRLTTPNDLVSTDVVVQLSLRSRYQLVVVIRSEAELDRAFEVPEVVALECYETQSITPS